MTQPLNGEESFDDMVKALGIISLIEMINHMNQVVNAFEVAGVFTTEGTEVLSKITTKYFEELNELIKAEREIHQAQRLQREN